MCNIAIMFGKNGIVLVKRFFTFDGKVCKVVLYSVDRSLSQVAKS